MIWKREKDGIYKQFDWRIVKFLNDTNNQKTIDNYENCSLIFKPPNYKDYNLVIMEGSWKTDRTWLSDDGTYFKTVYLWNNNSEPNIPFISPKTGQITDWNLKNQNNRFYVSHKIDNMDNPKTKQQKRNKASDKEFKTLQLKMLALNNKYGIPKNNLTQHTLLFGTTGSGKTTTVMFFVKQLTKIFKQTTIIIDGKGDIDLINKVKHLNPNAFIWEIDGTTEYNPFATKDSVVLSDEIMSLFDFSEPFYRDKAKHYLLILLNVLIEKKIDITLNNIIEYFNIEKLLKLVDVKSENYDMLTNNFEEKEISGMLSKLNITNMQLNNLLSKNNTLLELITKHKTILFSINSLKYPELAGSVGKVIIQDLKELTTLKQVNQKINIVLDEFNVFASETIINLINKSRSFNYQCFFSFQTISDLKTNNMNLTDTIFGNVKTIVCHNIKDPNTAEYVASVFGTQETEKLTRQLDFKNNTADMGSVRSVDEFIVHPNDLKTLKIGECYLKTTLQSGELFIRLLS